MYRMKRSRYLPKALVQKRICNTRFTTAVTNFQRSVAWQLSSLAAVTNLPQCINVTAKDLSSRACPLQIIIAIVESQRPNCSLRRCDDELQLPNRHSNLHASYFRASRRIRETCALRESSLSSWSICNRSWRWINVTKLTNEPLEAFSNRIEFRVVLTLRFCASANAPTVRLLIFTFFFLSWY